jgi:ribosomal protein S3
MENSQIAGIKISINGRFNGAARAKNRIIQAGKLPLQSINSKIDYAMSKSRTKFGVFGVKV